VSVNYHALWLPPNDLAVSALWWSGGPSGAALFSSPVQRRRCEEKRKIQRRTPNKGRVVLAEGQRYDLPSRRE